jgi:cell division septum initiation protein DivIVA
MQTSILSLVLALGLPGAPSCNSQQQPLPREEQNPPAATHHDDDADEEDADDKDGEDADEMDADAKLELAKVEEQECTDSKAKSGDCCEGEKQLKALGYTQGGKVVHLKEKDIDGKVQKVTIEPGSTVVLETKNGKQVVMHSQGPGTVNLIPADPDMRMYALGGLLSQGQPAPQPQDERVRELEKRVRELEAQLRERDGQGDMPGRTARRAPERYLAQAEAERAHAAEMREHLGAQAREFAEQARRQADEIREQAEVYRRQALEQSRKWRMYPGATAPEAPEAGELPEVPPAGAWWSGTPGQTAPMAKVPKPPKAARLPKTPVAPSPAAQQELQAMLEQMRAQMDEIRAQMQDLREELQKAPQHQLR